MARKSTSTSTPLPRTRKKTSAAKEDTIAKQPSTETSPAAEETKQQEHEHERESDITVVSAELAPDENKPLTEQERARFTELEAETLAALSEAQQSLLRAAQSLQEIRDDELFREDYPTFEAYCTQKLGLSKRFINYQINYAKVVDNFAKWEHDVPVLPSGESQVRPLAGLKPEVQPEVWTKAVEVAGGKVPSREIVTQVVQSYRAEQPQDKKKKKGKKRTIEVGDCIRIKGIPTTELSAFRNWWGFVKDVSDDGYEIELPHRTITGVKASNIALEMVGEHALNKQQTGTRRKLFERLSEIYRLKTETAEEEEELLEYTLSYFVTLKPRERVDKDGKKSTTVKLTSLEEKALGLLEAEVNKVQKKENK